MTDHKATPLGDDVGWPELAALSDDYGQDEVNDARAARAGRTLASYAKVVGEDDFQGTLSDLLTDLIHLADALDPAGEWVNFDAALRSARRNHEAETAGLS